jgi:hypothetical protein
MRALSGEEVELFLEGNPEAGGREPQETFVHLPFNPDFEIEKDKITFGEKPSPSLQLFIIILAFSCFDFPCSCTYVEKNVVLGSGAFGLVTRGMLDGHCEKVAIKTIKPYADPSSLKALLSELKIMARVGKHENIVMLIGAYTKEIKSGN